MIDPNTIEYIVAILILAAVYLTSFWILRNVNSLFGLVLFILASATAILAIASGSVDPLFIASVSVLMGLYSFLLALLDLRETNTKLEILDKASYTVDKGNNLNENYCSLVEMTSRLESENRDLRRISELRSSEVDSDFSKEQEANLQKMESQLLILKSFNENAKYEIDRLNSQNNLIQDQIEELTPLAKKQKRQGYFFLLVSALLIVFSINAYLGNSAVSDTFEIVFGIVGLLAILFPWIESEK